MVFTNYEDILDYIKEFIKDKQSICISIDGMCGSGKTTFAGLLQKELCTNLVHIDDFYIPKKNRKEDWFEAIAGNMDLCRFKESVLIPFSKKEDINYVRFNPYKQEYEKEYCIPYNPILIVDGTYSQHSSLKKYYQLNICIITSREQQYKRLSKREKENMKNFISCWIPKENTYLQTMHIVEKANIVLDTTNLF